MITGTVALAGNDVSGLGAFVKLTICTPTGQELEIEALIDTGFTGYLCMPPAMISDLGLSHKGKSQVRLADGRGEAVDYYRATVIWDDQQRAVHVYKMHDSIVGMSLIRGYELKVEAVVGGNVTINRLP